MFDGIRPSILERVGLGCRVDGVRHPLGEPFLLSTPDVSDGESIGGEESRYAKELGDSFAFSRRFRGRQRSIPVIPVRLRGRRGVCRVHVHS